MEDPTGLEAEADRIPGEREMAKDSFYTPILLGVGFLLLLVCFYVVRKRRRKKSRTSFPRS